MKKLRRRLALILTAMYFMVPVYAEEAVTQPVQDAYSYEAIVHEEILPAGTVIDEELLTEEPPKLSALYPDVNEDGVMTADVDLTTASAWDTILRNTYGEDYLSPLMKTKDEVRVSGRANKLMITNADLTLPGRNGLDVVIKREYDSQYDNNTYVGLSPGAGSHMIQNYVYLYDMLDINSNQIIKVGVYSEDFYYLYLKEGLYISSIDQITPKTHTAADGTVTRYYAYDNLMGYKTSEEKATVILRPVSEDYSRVVEVEHSAGYYAEAMKILGDRGNLGCGFRLLLPEVFMQRTYTETDTAGYPKRYRYDYSGSFRAIDGSVRSLGGNTYLLKYKDGTQAFSSSFSSTDNQFLKYRFFYEEQTLPDTDRKYRMAVYDARGYNYYFAGQDALSSRQHMYPVAVVDNFGNSILYDYGQDGRLIKITDTFGREITFTYTDNSAVISYPDGEEIKTISYTIEELSASEMENDSVLNGKPVQKFTYTNENAEQTSYYLRAASLPVLFDEWRSTDIEVSSYYIRSGTDTTQMRLQSTYNLEKIVYPTGKVSEYRYTPRYFQCKYMDVLRGYYCVKESYDTEENQRLNEKVYSTGGKGETSVRYTTADGFWLTRYFDRSERLVREASSSHTYYYLYTGNAPYAISRERFGLTYSENYTYYTGYDYLIRSVFNGQKKVEYTYHTVDGSITDMIQTATYSKYVNSSWVIDYIISTGLTEDNQKIAWEEITKDGIVRSRKDYTYNPQGEIISETTKLNENESLTVNTEYSVTDNKTLNITSSVSGITDADGTDLGLIAQSSSLDMYGNIISATDALGGTASVEYDNAGRATKHTYPNGGYINIEYNLSDNYIILTEISGARLKYSYNKLGNLVKLERISGAETRLLEEYVYDALSRIIEKKTYISENAGQKTEYTYDNTGRVLTEKVSKTENDEWCYTNTYSYKTSNKQYIITASSSAADGSVKAIENSYYDCYDNLTKKELINGNKSLSESYSYDYENRLISYKDFNGNTERYTYDYNGNLLSVARADGTSSSNSYDMAGRKISSTDYMGNTTSYTYDKLSQLIKTISPFDERASEIKYYYDKAGNRIKKTTGQDSDSRITEEYTYDNMNSLTGAVVGEGAERSAVKYSYDLSGNMLSMTTGISSLDAAGGKTTAYEYNSFGELIKETDPMGYTKAYSYNFSGSPVSITDKNGQTISYTYDMFGLTSETAGDIINTVTRDSFGRETAKASGSTVETTAYDAFGRISQSQSGSISKEYTYDNNSNLTGFVLKDNNVEKQNVSYTYNNLEQITEITDNGITTAFTYNLNGNPVSKTRNGITTVYEYNKAGLVTKITGANTYEAEYYQNGMKSSETASGATKQYTYDSLGRLSAVSGSVSESYTYDSGGNRLSKTSSDGVYTYAYDANNRLITEIKTVNGDAQSETSYFYDRNGNIFSERVMTAGEGEFSVSSTNPGGVKFYGYDELNRLISYSDENGEISYTYGADNLRRTKTVNGIVTNYVWNGQNMVYEYTGDTANVYGYDVLGIASADMNGAQYFYEKDTHGNIRAVLNAEGEILQSHEYEPFGEKADTNSSLTPFGYAGEYLDSETNLIYLRNRYYAANSGRFISEDPIKDGLNWYVYANNNPLKYVDPTGLSSEERLGEGIWSFKNDKFGVSILSHWLFGGGTDYVQENGVWGTYMKDNSLLKTKVQEIVFPLANDVKNNSSKTIDITTSMEIQNGEDIIGYQYLHGTNADVGGFQIKGTVLKNKKGDITYDLTYTWNDKIDPNFMYYSDSKKAEFAKSIPLANPTDYTIRITWSDKTVIKAKPTWYNRNTGWLK